MSLKASARLKKHQFVLKKAGASCCLESCTLFLLSTPKVSPPPEDITRYRMPRKEKVCSSSSSSKTAQWKVTLMRGRGSSYRRALWQPWMQVHKGKRMGFVPCELVKGWTKETICFSWLFQPDQPSSPNAGLSWWYLGKSLPHWSLKQN